MKTPKKIEGMFQELVDALCENGQLTQAFAVARIGKQEITKAQCDKHVDACIRNRELGEAVGYVAQWNTSEEAYQRFVEALVSEFNSNKLSRKTSATVSSLLYWLTETQQFEKARTAAKLLGQKPLTKAEEERITAEHSDRRF